MNPKRKAYGLAHNEVGTPFVNNEEKDHGDLLINPASMAAIPSGSWVISSSNQRFVMPMPPMSKNVYRSFKASSPEPGSSRI